MATRELAKSSGSSESVRLDWRSAPRVEERGDCDVLPLRRDVVAEILSDGSIRHVDGGQEEPNTSSWAEGEVSGPTWTLWWARRSWA